MLQGIRRLVANVVGRNFVLDSDKAIDEVNGYRWAEGRGRRKLRRSAGTRLPGLENRPLQHVIIDGSFCLLPKSGRRDQIARGGAG